MRRTNSNCPTFEDDFVTSKRSCSARGEIARAAAESCQAILSPVIYTIFNRTIYLNLTYHKPEKRIYSAILLINRIALYDPFSRLKIRGFRCSMDFSFRNSPRSSESSLWEVSTVIVPRDLRRPTRFCDWPKTRSIPRSNSDPGYNRRWIIRPRCCCMNTVVVLWCSPHWPCCTWNWSSRSLECSRGRATGSIASRGRKYFFRFLRRSRSPTGRDPASRWPGERRFQLTFTFWTFGSFLPRCKAAEELERTNCIGCSAEEGNRKPPTFRPTMVRPGSNRSHDASTAKNRIPLLHRVLLIRPP